MHDLRDVAYTDENGERIDFFTQWDLGQKLLIDVTDIVEESRLKIIPQVHFSNAKSDAAFVVGRPDVKIEKKTIDGKTRLYIWTKVPNKSLRTASPLNVYVYLDETKYDQNDTNYMPGVNIDYPESHKMTVCACVRIPVRKRAKPDDYQYVENITRITAETIKEEIAIDFANGKWMLFNLKMADSMNDQVHDMYVANDKLRINNSEDKKYAERILLDNKDRDEIAADLAKEVDTLNKTITNKEQVMSARVAKLREDMSSADAAIRKDMGDKDEALDKRIDDLTASTTASDAALSKKIDDTDAATNKKVDNVNESLSKSISDNNTSINKRVDDVNAALSDAITKAQADAMSSSNSYTDNKISALIDNAPDTLDTLKEISDALSEDDKVMDTLNKAIGTKFATADFNTFKTSNDTALSNINTAIGTKLTTSDFNSYKVSNDKAVSDLSTALDNYKTSNDKTVSDLSSAVSKKVETSDFNSYKTEVSGKFDSVNSDISGKASSTHNHDTSDITSGVLSVERGGTGVASVDALKAILGITGQIVPTGAMIQFAGDIAPSGYLLCDGSDVDKETYAGLFAVIGTKYGASEDDKLFKLPNSNSMIIAI